METVSLARTEFTECRETTLPTFCIARAPNARHRNDPRPLRVIRLQPFHLDARGMNGDVPLLSLDGRS
jgi:hypothetical protein